MSLNNSQHTTVLLDKAVECLFEDNYHKNGIYIDGTFGRGGHTKKILSMISQISQANDYTGSVIAVDKDLEAINSAVEQDLLNKYNYFKIFHNSFSDIKHILEENNMLPNSVNGILLDLRISSPQIDIGERGFSFMRNGPLDMRMDITQGEPLSEILKKLNADELANIIFEYGEDKQSRKIARAIKDYNLPILDTQTLANIIASVIRQKSAQHPATKTFQALRIYINRELEDLKEFLKNLPSILAPNGKIVIISFHSLEDRIVKQALNTWAKPDKNHDVPRHLLALHPVIKPDFELLGKFKPSAEEIKLNPRARSAVMRVAKKVF